MKQRIDYLGVCVLAGVLVGVGCSKTEDPERVEDAGQGEDDADAAQDPGACDTTWKAVQRTIFEGRGCTESACHSDKAKAGGLDLSPEVAYQNLVFADSEASLTVPLYRIHPGEQALSLLYLKVAAAADEEAKLPAGAGAPMPSGAAPLSAEQLAGLRLWIRAGAPETGVVEGTQELLGCDLPSDADPNRTIQPPVPAADEGFQHASGTWTVEPESEGEVCYATYYDLSDSAPDWARFPCELNGDSHTCVGFKRRQLSQDAQSHHSIINVYSGAASANDPRWGAWRCVGGALDKKTCDPLRLGESASAGGADCGEGVCQSEPVHSVACRGYGPSDRDLKSISAGGAQSPVSSQRFPEGVYGQLPIKGIVVWNSHGFNLTSKPADIGQFNTFWYARPEERTYLVRRIFDSRYIFTMTVPPFESREYCASFTLPRYAHLASLSSHVHKRGVLWRSWLPPNTAGCLPSSSTCTPNEGTPDYVSKSYNDPLTIDYAPALVFDADDAAERTIKYCAVFDNGKEFPELVKQRSKLPQFATGCAQGQIFCLDGANKGQACVSDADCPGSSCDACTVNGGVTTEDEMFILLGDYYVVPPSP